MWFEVAEACEFAFPGLPLADVISGPQVLAALVADAGFWKRILAALHATKEGTAGTPEAGAEILRCEICGRGAGCRLAGSLRVQIPSASG